MNREILFRGKRVNNRKFVEGYLFDDGYQEPRHVFVGGLVIDEYKGTACDEWDINGINFCDVDPDTIASTPAKRTRTGRKSLMEIFWKHTLMIPFLRILRE